MIPWIRATLLAGVAALGAGIACGTAGSVSPPDKIPCDRLYYGGGKLPPPPDGSSLCARAPGECNYQSQEGCAAGETCAPHVDTIPTAAGPRAVGTVTPTCRVAGERASGEACDSSSTSAAKQCGRGLQCADGACHRLCCGADWSACDPGESCIRQAEVNIDGTITQVGADLCFPVGTCNVLEPDSCKTEGRICRIADPVGHVACMPPSDLGVGATCDQGHQCGAVLHCVKSDKKNVSGNTCRQLCPWGICPDKTCGAADLCVRFNRDPPGVGECTPSTAALRGLPILVDGGVVDAAGLFRPEGDGGP
jgi:hypothetical protein